MDHIQIFGLIEAADARRELHGYEITMEGVVVAPDLKPQTRSELVFDGEFIEPYLADRPAA